MSAKLVLVNSDSIRREVETAFERERKLLKKSFPYADIQHVGGTALPNSPTKGDLDIQVRVPQNKFEESKATLIGMFDKNKPDRWTKGWASFNKDENGSIPVGIQLTAIGTKDDEHYKLRDKLISNPELLEEYNRFKQSFEGRTHQEYRDAKDAFFGPSGSNKLLVK